MQWRRGFGLILLMAAALNTWANPVQLSEQERLWIQQHPVLRVGVLEDFFPLEYMSGGVLQGRSGEYLQWVADATGLAFTYVPAKTQEQRERMLLDGQVDLLSLHLHFRSEPPSASLHTLTYDTTLPIIVTRIGSSGIFDLEQLQGKKVMIPNVDHYEQMFAESGVLATLVRSTSALEMLTSVQDGQAYAAVATEAFLMPYLYRRFQGDLATTGVVGDAILDISMAVRTDQAMLYSILEKVLSSISVQQRNEIYKHWSDPLTGDEPTLLKVASHYLHLVVLGVLVLASLCALAFYAHRQWRQAVRNEQEKAMFLTVMGHEIRSPMNAVLAAMELLWHTRLNEQQRHFAHLANSGANALVRLLEGVLRETGSNAKPLQLAIEPTDMAALVQAVVGLHSLRAREKQLTLKADIPTELPLLLLDSSRLTQIFHNLLSNAIKFTETGGVDINLHLVTLLDDNRLLQVEVRDTGIGMSDEVQASLFQPYAQASQSYKHSGGTGLGLMICRQLVGLMTGTLTLKSEPDVGTVITLCLPVIVASEPVIAPPVDAVPDQVVASGLQILVVEDTLANQEVLRAQILGFNCQPVLAADAAQARALFEQSTYALVLMDCDLPDQDGYSLVRDLRAFESRQGRVRCPIIAISALTGELHLQRCVDAGMDASLSKPIRLGPLREMIEYWCEVNLEVPRVGLMLPVLDHVAINREAAADLGSLVKAIALCDRASALHVAHRMHGAALIMGWSALGLAAEHMEYLLRGDEGWDNPAYAQALIGLIRNWYVLSDNRSLEALPATQPYQATSR